MYIKSLKKVSKMTNCHLNINFSVIIIQYTDYFHDIVIFQYSKIFLI